MASAILCKSLADLDVRWIASNWRFDPRIRIFFADTSKDSHRYASETLKCTLFNDECFLPL